MRSGTIFLLTLLFPVMAMSDGSISGQDRLSECTTLRTDPNDIHECYFTVGDEVEREMVQAYLIAQRAVNAFDLRHSLDLERSTNVLLQESQAAFEEYRKLHCIFPEREALGGTAAINGIVECRVELTLLRIEQLNEIASIF